jgi:hypothetical protein
LPKKNEVSEVVILSDKNCRAKELDFENSHKVKVNECWSFNSYNNILSISKAIREENQMPC